MDGKLFFVIRLFIFGLRYLIYYYFLFPFQEIEEKEKELLTALQEIATADQGTEKHHPYRSYVDCMVAQAVDGPLCDDFAKMEVLLIIYLLDIKKKIKKICYYHIILINLIPPFLLTAKCNR